MPDLVLLIPIGIAIGVLLGAVGGGGSLLAVPALLYVGDQSVRAAQAGALVVVIGSSVTGMASYLRRGQVRWRAGLAFGAAVGASSFAGSLLSRQLDPDVLLLAFSPVMVAGAVAMVSQRARGPSSFRPWRLGVRLSSVVEVTLFGLAVGWLTGLFGVGGGFVIVPVLVLGLGFSVVEAVGTSLLVIIIGSSVALASRLGGAIDWAEIAPFAAAAIAGVLVGSIVADHTSTRALTNWFAGLVVLTALYTGGKALSALL